MVGKFIWRIHRWDFLCSGQWKKKTYEILLKCLSLPLLCTHVPGLESGVGWQDKSSSSSPSSQPPSQPVICRQPVASARGVLPPRPLYFKLVTDFLANYPELDREMRGADGVRGVIISNFFIPTVLFQFKIEQSIEKMEIFCKMCCPDCCNTICCPSETENHYWVYSGKNLLLLDAKESSWRCCR